MRKLIGKVRQSWRRSRDKTATRESRVGSMYLGRLDHVTHYRAAGENLFLCGIVYEVERQYTGINRPARTSAGVSCNRCQRVHNALMRTPLGRQRLGVDKYDGEPVSA